MSEQRRDLRYPAPGVEPAQLVGDDDGTGLATDRERFAADRDGLLVLAAGGVRAGQLGEVDALLPLAQCGPPGRVVAVGRDGVGGAAQLDEAGRARGVERVLGDVVPDPVL